MKLTPGGKAAYNMMVELAVKIKLHVCSTTAFVRYNFIQIVTHNCLKMASKKALKVASYLHRRIIKLLYTLYLFSTTIEIYEKL